MKSEGKNLGGFMKNTAKTVQDYINSLAPECKEAIAQLRNIILNNLPKGYEEGIMYNMPAYYIPLSTYPTTYNGQPLTVAALACQKNYMSLYLMGTYADQETEQWFKDRLAVSGKKLDMGKSCIRFKKVDDLPLDLIAEVIARISVQDYIANYEKARGIDQ
jgi:uncharacterized protein YdhG (YjbR/CyaY superfamily)